MAKPGFKIGDKVIITKIIPEDNDHKIRGSIQVGEIGTITRDRVLKNLSQAAYYLEDGRFIGYDEECELAQSYLNEQKMKKLLGVE